MAKQQLSARLEADTIAAVDAWAQAHGTTRTEALERILSQGMASSGGESSGDAAGPSAGELRALRDHLEDMRQQVAEKDRQIGELVSAVGRAQALQAAAERRALEAAQAVQGDEDEDVLDQEPTEDEDGPHMAPTGSTGGNEDGGNDTDEQEATSDESKRPTWLERLSRWFLGA